MDTERASQFENIFYNHLSLSSLLMSSSFYFHTKLHFLHAYNLFSIELPQ
jgi:hypothetical protein